jgi:hypothetical protein
VHKSGKTQLEPPWSSDPHDPHEDCCSVQTFAYKLALRLSRMIPANDLSHKNLILIVLMFLLSAAYMAKELKRGWVPLDEGTLGQSAERVLRGELPHRDFDDVYTGGLAFLDAAVFRVLGPESANLRYVAYVFFLASVLAMFYIASRFVSVPVACAITFLAVGWGYPNYAAPMPSWFNLFFATYGLAALIRYIEARKWIWLLMAGMCGGFSLLAKVAGLFFISSVFLFLLYREQLANENQSAPRKKTGLYPIFVYVCVLAYMGLLLALLRHKLNAVTFGYFFVPGSLIAAFIAWSEFRATLAAGRRFAFLIRELGIFSLGVLIPLALFIIPYAREGGLADVIRGVFVLPARRFQYASYIPTLFGFLRGVVIDSVVLWGVFLAPPKLARWARIAIALVSPVALMVAVRYGNAQRSVWSVIWNSMPAAIIAGLVVLLWQARGLTASDSRQKLFLVLSVTAGCSLIQFPFAAPIYFCYVAGLVALSCAAVLSHVEFPWPWFFGFIYGSVLCYALFEVTPGFLYAMGNHYERDTQTEVLTLPRAGGLRVSRESATTYGILGKVIKDHARGEYLYATPDCPEINFLYDFHNPTRTLFEFVDDPIGRTNRILNALHNRDVNIIVINQQPEFSDAVPPDLLAALEKEYPEQQEVGQFVVRWKP